MLAPVSLERKAQCNRWSLVGVVALHLVGEEWIDSGVPDLVSAPAKKGVGIVLLGSVGEIEDAQLHQGPQLLPEGICAPILQKDVDMRRVSVKSHVHVIMQLGQVGTVTIVVDIRGSFEVIVDVSPDIVGRDGFFRISFSPAIDKKIVNIGFGGRSPPQLLKVLLDHILKWPRHPKVVGSK